MAKRVVLAAAAQQMIGNLAAMELWAKEMMVEDRLGSIVIHG